MATKGKTTKQSAHLSPTQLAASLPKLRKRLAELKALDVRSLTEQTGGQALDALSQKINATLRDTFGADSLEYQEHQIETFQPNFAVWFSGMDTSLRGNIDTVARKVADGVRMLDTLIELFEESLEPEGDNSGSRAIRAYGNLDLHPEIARAASRLYADGHYANAVEASVKALNGLVRLRSSLEVDGTALMERAFSPNNPILKFNELISQSDKDEQKGFMQMFAGAVSGLRNPRAHSFIQDDPERALEFVAFVSLLAKLLDETTV